MRLRSLRRLEMEIMSTKPCRRAQDIQALLKNAAAGNGSPMNSEQTRQKFGSARWATDAPTYAAPPAVEVTTMPSSNAADHRHPVGQGLDPRDEGHIGEDAEVRFRKAIG